MINFAFALAMKALGFEIGNSEDSGTDHGHDTEYPNVADVFRIFIINFRSSIGDVQMPFYKFWAKVIEKDVTLGQIMIAIVHIVWFISILFNNVVLLNFLISYIS